MRALLVYNLITFRGRLTRLLVVFAVVLAVSLLLRDIPLGGLSGVLLLSVIRVGGDGEAQRRWLLTMPVSRRQLVACSYITEAALGDVYKRQEYTPRERRSSGMTSLSALAGSEEIGRASCRERV